MGVQNIEHCVQNTMPFPMEPIFIGMSWGERSVDSFENGSASFYLTKISSNYGELFSPLPLLSIEYLVSYDTSIFTLIQF